ncbi:UDP-3-O-(3-hydroxymyristoyl)glucosamine N-acyltransferase [Roseomonas sp. BN140053]|uniref:UDP-3-O-(3-hydroxymyristoyl)glucosamine N-acyltransferase n=1 Tax=Roseomonas sp. BN140053 TaxID=3391898 RepID=UPI0039EAAFA9
MAADPRFHPASGPFTLGDIAKRAGLQGPAEAERLFRGVAPLSEAGPDEVSFAEGRRNADALRATRAGAVLVSAALAPEVPGGTIALVTPSPQLGFARVAAAFHPPARPKGGIHPTAVIAADAMIGEDCEIGPYAVVGEGAVLGPRCILGPHAVVGAGCVFGADGHLHAHASAQFCVAGDRVVLHGGARVGNEGFGFVPDDAGGFVTVPQLGRVVLGDGVEIGANACVDRGAAGDTVLGAGTRLDNLVMLGHNVRTGRGCVVVAQVGISGSTVLGNHVTVAGQAGLAGHLKVGDRARIGAQAGVLSDIPAGMDVFGTPAIPVREAFRAAATLRKLAAGRFRSGRRDGTDETE